MEESLRRLREVLLQMFRGNEDDMKRTFVVELPMGKVYWGRIFVSKEGKAYDIETGKEITLVGSKVDPAAGYSKAKDKYVLYVRGKPVTYVNVKNIGDEEIIRRALKRNILLRYPIEDAINFEIARYNRLSFMEKLKKELPEGTKIYIDSEENVHVAYGPLKYVFNASDVGKDPINAWNIASRAIEQIRNVTQFAKNIEKYLPENAKVVIGENGSIGISYNGTFYGIPFVSLPGNLTDEEARKIAEKYISTFPDVFNKQELQSVSTTESNRSNKKENESKEYYVFDNKNPTKTIKNFSFVITDIKKQDNEILQENINNVVISRNSTNPVKKINTRNTTKYRKQVVKRKIAGRKPAGLIMI